MQIIINNVAVNMVERDGKAFATSRNVAEVFEKQHKHILNVIRAIPERAKSNFRFSEYYDATGRKLPMYEMNRDGFSFLVMGFAGERVDNWKLDFIEGFNKMERIIQNQSHHIPQFLAPKNFTMTAIASMAQSFIGLEQDVKEIKADIQSLQDTSAFTSNDCRLYLNAVNTKVDGVISQYQNNSKSTIYPQIHNAVKEHYQVGSYKDLPHYKIDEVIDFVKALSVKVRIAK
jgi:Rha family phage regulatory protein